MKSKSLQYGSVVYNEGGKTGELNINVEKERNMTLEQKQCLKLYEDEKFSKRERLELEKYCIGLPVSDSDDGYTFDDYRRNILPNGCSDDGETDLELFDSLINGILNPKTNYFTTGNKKSNCDSVNKFVKRFKNQVFGKGWKVSKKVGEGEFGTVHLLCENNKNGCSRIVKIIRYTDGITDKDIALEGCIQNYVYEHTDTKLAPKVIGLHHFEEEQIGAIVMEYINGETIGALHEKYITGIETERISKVFESLYAKVPEEAKTVEFGGVNDIIMSVVNWNILREFSKINVVHGDLHQDNILVTDSGRLKVIDYGYSFIDDSKRFENADRSKIKSIFENGEKYHNEYFNMFTNMMLYRQTTIYTKECTFGLE
jgi:serine/threonine protein kinase